MSKRTMAALILTALLVFQGTAMAKYDAGGGGASATSPTAGTCDLVLGTTFTNDDELSANERVIADAWKSDLHARKAAALEGLG